MNIVRQFLAFDDYLLYNQQLSSGQIALWRALMSINNKAGWAEWFTAANTTIETLSGLSRSGINKNRNSLKQLGLIDFRSNGKKATSYHVCTLYTSDNTQQSVQDNTQEPPLSSNSTQESVQQGVQDSTQGSAQQSAHKSGTLNKLKQKLNKTETKTNNNYDLERRKVSEMYSQKIIPMDRPEQIDRVQSFVEGEFPLDVVLFAIDYAASEKKQSANYIVKLLNGWKKSGVKTVEDAGKAIENFRQSFSSGYAKQPVRKEPIPEWFDDPEGYNARKEAELTGHSLESDELPF